jgi:hypothetical protein
MMVQLYNDSGNPVCTRFQDSGGTSGARRHGKTNMATRSAGWTIGRAPDLQD